MPFLLVIPGRGIAADPEPMNTVLSKGAPFMRRLQPSVCLGSGFDPAGRPGMTEVWVKHA